MRLSKTEWDLLVFLVNNKGRVLSHEVILEVVWGPAYRDQHHLLHDTISRLRHRLQSTGISQDPIESVHGVGYLFVEIPE